MPSRNQQYVMLCGMVCCTHLSYPRKCLCKGVYGWSFINFCSQLVPVDDIHSVFS